MSKSTSPSVSCARRRARSAAAGVDRRASDSTDADTLPFVTESGSGAFIGNPPCCALRNSPWERPGGSCLRLLLSAQTPVAHQLDDDIALVDEVRDHQLAQPCAVA